MLASRQAPDLITGHWLLPRIRLRVRAGRAGLTDAFEALLQDSGEDGDTHPTADYEAAISVRRRSSESSSTNCCAGATTGASQT